MHSRDQGAGNLQPNEIAIPEFGAIGLEIAAASEREIPGVQLAAIPVNNTNVDKRLSTGSGRLFDLR